MRVKKAVAVADPLPVVDPRLCGAGNAAVAVALRMAERQAWDWFAAAAIKERPALSSPEDVAQRAAAVADAMMEERKKRGGRR